MYIFSGLTAVFSFFACLFKVCKHKCCLFTYMAASFPIFLFVIVAGAVALKISTLPESEMIKLPLLVYGASAILGGLLLIAIQIAAWFVFYKVVSNNSQPRQS